MVVIGRGFGEGVQDKSKYICVAVTGNQQLTQNTIVFYNTFIIISFQPTCGIVIPVRI